MHTHCSLVAVSLPSGSSCSNLASRRTPGIYVDCIKYVPYLLLTGRCAIRRCMSDAGSSAQNHYFFVRGSYTVHRLAKGLKSTCYAVTVHKGLKRGSYQLVCEQSFDSFRKSAIPFPAFIDSSPRRSERIEDKPTTFFTT